MLMLGVGLIVAYWFFMGGGMEKLENMVSGKPKGGTFTASVGGITTTISGLPIKQAGPLSSGQNMRKININRGNNTANVDQTNSMLAKQQQVSFY